MSFKLTSQNVNVKLNYVDSLAFNMRYFELTNNDYFCHTDYDYEGRNAKRFKLPDSALVDLYRECDSTFFNEILKNEIIIVNEDHYFPQNRKFITKLVKTLISDTNFYFFFEALAKDITYNFNQVELNRSYGHYLQEPNMARIINLIISNNRPVLSYESSKNHFDKGKYSLLNPDQKIDKDFYKHFINTIEGNTGGLYTNVMSIRDMNQFINFYSKYNIIKSKNKNAKFMIMCGHGHVAEKRNTHYKNVGWFNFCYLLRQYLKTDPLTIELTNLTEKCPSQRNLYYNSLVAINNNEGFMYSTYDKIDSLKLTNAIYGSIDCDYIILSPPVKMINNRESWLLSAEKQFYKIPENILSKIKKGSLIKCYKHYQDINCGVPVDVVKVTDNNTYLIIEKGNFNLVVDNKIIAEIDNK